MTTTPELSTGWTREKFRVYVNENDVLENADLSGLDLSWMSIESVTFRGVKLHDADLSSSIHEGCTFENCDLARANISRSSWKNVEMTNCVLDDVDASDINLRVCSLERCLGSRVNLDNVEVTAAWWTEVILTNATIIDAELNNVEIKQSTLRGIDCRKTRFVDVSISESDLYAWNLEDSGAIDCGVWRNTGDPAVIVNFVDYGWLAQECLVTTNLLGSIATVIPRSHGWLIYLDGWWGTLERLREALATDGHPIFPIGIRVLGAKSLDVRHREVEAFANFAEVWMDTHSDVLDAYCAHLAARNQPHDDLA